MSDGDGHGRVGISLFATFRSGKLVPAFICYL